MVKAEFEKAHASQALTAAALLDKWQVAADRRVATAAFQAMDVDSNGRIDKTEFSANVRGLFLAVDESMKGAHMLSGS